MSDPDPAGTRVGVVGAGKVGLVLARRVQATGGRVSAVWDPVEPARERARELLGVAPVGAAADVVSHADVVLLAVPDDALAAVVEGLATEDAPWAEVTVVHVSGRYGAAVLAPLARLGARTAAAHPAMTFTGDLETEVGRVAGAQFAVTGGPDGAAVASRLVEALGGSPIPVDEDDRGIYHAALAHSTNHLVTLVVQAAAMLTEIGVTDVPALLGPPVRAALANALANGPAGATGPVVRGDVGTVSTHLREIAARHPEVLDSYRHLSAATADIAATAGRLDPATHGELLLVLRADDRRPAGTPPPSPSAPATPGGRPSRGTAA